VAEVDDIDEEDKEIGEEKVDGPEPPAEGGRKDIERTEKGEDEDRSVHEKGKPEVELEPDVKGLE
jgi:hypothetical protein